MFATPRVCPIFTAPRCIFQRPSSSLSFQTGVDWGLFASKRWAMECEEYGVGSRIRRRYHSRSRASRVDTHRCKHRQLAFLLRVLGRPGQCTRMALLSHGTLDRSKSQACVCVCLGVFRAALYCFLVVNTSAVFGHTLCREDASLCEN